MSSHTVLGLTLQQHAVGEYDKILVLLTREEGLKRVMAKGAQRPRSKLGGRTEPLQSGHWHLARGKNLDIATQCETVHAHRALRGDLDRLMFALHLAELVATMLPEAQPHPEIYDLLEGGLLALEGATSPELVTAWTELALLDALGYAPELEACARCGAQLLADACFSGAEGGALCPGCAAFADTRRGARGLALLRRLRAVELATLLPHTVANDMLTEARAMLKAALLPHATRALRALATLPPPATQRPV